MQTLDETKAAMAMAPTRGSGEPVVGGALAGRRGRPGRRRRRLGWSSRGMQGEGAPRPAEHEPPVLSRRLHCSFPFPLLARAKAAGAGAVEDGGWRTRERDTGLL